LSQGVQQLRAEQSRHVIDIDEKQRAEQRHFRQRTTESQARHGDHEQRSDVLEGKLDSLTQAMAVLERRTSIKLWPMSSSIASAASTTAPVASAVANGAGAGAVAAIGGRRAQSLPPEEFRHHHYSDAALVASPGTAALPAEQRWP
ncbi:unnamed protein product, partial [Polarella glacialis]